jgi:hypothetical protein
MYHSAKNGAYGSLSTELTAENMLLGLIYIVKEDYG